MILGACEPCVNMEAWDFGKHVSCDEQTIGF
jgi:hypothetical protein